MGDGGSGSANASISSSLMPRMTTMLILIGASPTRSSRESRFHRIEVEAPALGDRRDPISPQAIGAHVDAIEPGSLERAPQGSWQSNPVRRKGNVLDQRDSRGAWRRSLAKIWANRGLSTGRSEASEAPSVSKLLRPKLRNLLIRQQLIARQPLQTLGRQRNRGTGNCTLSVTEMRRYFRCVRPN